MTYNFIFYGEGTPDDILAVPFMMHGQFISMDTFRGTIEKEGYESKNNMLIVDCSVCNTTAFTALTEQIKELLAHDQPVLLYKPEAAHKLILSQMGLLKAYIGEDSLALFLEPQRDEKGRLHVVQTEHCGCLEEGLCMRELVRWEDGKIVSTGIQNTYKVKTPQTLSMDDLKPFVDRIKDTMHTLVRQGSITWKPRENTPPSDIPDTLWYNEPINVFYTLTPAGSPGESGYTPPQGKVTLEMGLGVGVYYDNKKYSTPVQMLNIITEGHLHTQMQNDNADARGWSISAFDLDGQNFSSGDIISVTSSPNNVSKSTQYTSGSEFSVGVSAGTEGIAADASYTISSSQTYSINDWDIIQKDPNSWLFKQNVPYDGTSSVFPDGAAGNDGVNNLPDISKTTLNVSANTVWRQHPASRQKRLSIPYSFHVTARYVWADDHSKTSWHAWAWRYIALISKNLIVDFSRAYPSGK